MVSLISPPSLPSLLPSLPLFPSVLPAYHKRSTCIYVHAWPCADVAKGLALLPLFSPPSIPLPPSLSLHLSHPLTTIFNTKGVRITSCICAMCVLIEPRGARGLGPLSPLPPSISSPSLSPSFSSPSLSPSFSSPSLSPSFSLPPLSLPLSPSPPLSLPFSLPPSLPLSLPLPSPPLTTIFKTKGVRITSCICAMCVLIEPRGARGLSPLSPSLPPSLLPLSPPPSLLPLSPPPSLLPLSPLLLPPPLSLPPSPSPPLSLPFSSLPPSLPLSLPLPPPFPSTYHNLQHKRSQNNQLYLCYVSADRAQRS